jgi:hypothetical protein
MSDKVELRNAGETEGNLVILKSEVEKWLWSKEKINDPKYEVELKKLQELFEKNKKDIKFITQSELRELTGAINDTAPNGKAEETGRCLQRWQTNWWIKIWEKILLKMHSKNLKKKEKSRIQNQQKRSNNWYK